MGRGRAAAMRPDWAADQILEERGHTVLQFRSGVRPALVKGVAKRAGHRFLSSSNDFIQATHADLRIVFALQG